MFISLCFVSFTRQYHVWVRYFLSPFDPYSVEDSELFTRFSHPGLSWKQRDIPGSRKFSILMRLGLKTPVGLLTQTFTGFQYCPRPAQTRRLQRYYFEAQYKAFEFAVYASQWWLLNPHARLASGGWSSLTVRARPARNLTKGFNMPDFHMTLLLSSDFQTRCAQKWAKLSTGNSQFFYVPNGQKLLLKIISSDL